jgi:hypothetical protein
MMDTLAKSPLSNRVIVLLTDGETDDRDLSRYPVATLIKEAKKRNIRIFSIGIKLSAVGNNYLRQISQGTDAEAFDASNCDSLQKALETITDIVGRGTITREPFAITVNAPQIVVSDTVRFDPTYFGQTTCRTVTLVNVGEGDAVIDRADVADLLGGSTSEFSLASSVNLPLTISEEEQAQVTVCFTPNGLRDRAADASFNYNSCDLAAPVSHLRGVGYAVANLRVNDTLVGLPGTTVMMPVHFDSSLVGYGVHVVRYRIRWNNSMLDLRGVRPGGAAAGGTVEITSPVTTEGRDATAEITVSKDNLGAPGELAQIEFQVLRGDTLATPVELMSGTFQDGNPRIAMTNVGLVAYDSTCFRNGKAITFTSPAAKVTAGEVTPNPVTQKSVTIPLDASDVTTVAVALFGMDGAQLVPEKTYPVAAGTSTLTLDLSALRPGSYYARLKTQAGETIFRRILLVQ